MKPYAYHQRRLEMAVEKERNFWQLAMILVALAAVLIGLGIGKGHAELSRSSSICVAPARVLQLKAECKREDIQP